MQNYDRAASYYESGLAQNPYHTPSADYYHALRRHLLGKLSLDDLLGMIRTSKQRCEFAYYIGLAARLKGDFAQAAQWYHLCWETLLQNNGEFHWAENELRELQINNIPASMKYKACAKIVGCVRRQP